MKAFVAACLILLLLIGSVTAHGIVIHGHLGDTIDAVLSLPDRLPEKTRQETPEAVRLSSLWDDTKLLTILTVSAARIESVERALRTLHAGWDARDDALYRQARAELLLLLTQIRASESFSIESIL